jgi:hypothetical protein
VAGIGDDLVDPSVAPKPRSGLLRRLVGDTAVGLGKGIVEAGQGAVGLADLITQGKAGKAAEMAGFDPKSYLSQLDTHYSPEAQAAQKNVADAHGFVDTATAMLHNPSTILDQTAQSIPSMIGGGGIARGLEKVAGGVGERLAGTKLAELAAKSGIDNTVVRSGIGEGAVQAGQAAEQSREGNKDGLLTGKQSLAAIGSGVGDALITTLSGGLSHHLGIADIDTLFAGGKSPVAAAGKASPGLIKRTLEGILSEGVLQELPQSAQEQVFQNYADGKPLMEGVGAAGAQGLLAGAAMGGPTAALAPHAQGSTGNTDPNAPVAPTTPGPGAPQTIQPSGPVVITPSRGVLSRAVAAGAAEGHIPGVVVDHQVGQDFLGAHDGGIPPAAQPQAVDAVQASPVAAARGAALGIPYQTVNNGTPIQIKPFPHLSPRGRLIEATAAQQVLSDPAAALAAYKALPGTDGGRIINTDEARELFTDYNHGPEGRTHNAQAVQEPASFVSKAAWQERLAQPVEKGRDPMVLFTAGGSGAGKTSGIARQSAAQDLHDSADIVYDSNMANFDSANEKIQQALDSQRKVSILYVHRDPLEAFIGGVLTRANKEDYGRAVSIPAHASTHIGSAQTHAPLVAHWAGHPNVTINAIDSDGKLADVTKSIASVAAMPHNQLEEHLHAAAQDAIKNGIPNQDGGIDPLADRVAEHYIPGSRVDPSTGAQQGAVGQVRPAGSNGQDTGQRQAQPGSVQAQAQEVTVAQKLGGTVDPALLAQHGLTAGKEWKGQIDSRRLAEFHGAAAGPELYQHLQEHVGKPSHQVVVHGTKAQFDAARPHLAAAGVELGTDGARQAKAVTAVPKITTANPLTHEAHRALWKALNKISPDARFTGSLYANTATTNKADDLDYSVLSDDIDATAKQVAQIPGVKFDKEGIDGPTGERYLKFEHEWKGGKADISVVPRDAYANRISGSVLSATMPQSFRDTLRQNKQDAYEKVLQAKREHGKGSIQYADAKASYEAVKAAAVKEVNRTVQGPAFLGSKAPVNNLGIRNHEQHYSVIVAPKPGTRITAEDGSVRPYERGTDGANLPPAAEPVQRAPDLNVLQAKTTDIFKRPAVTAFLAKQFGIKGLKVVSFRGSYDGQPELSFSLRAPSLTEANSKQLANFLGLALSQDSAIVGKPEPLGVDKDAIPTFRLYNTDGTKLSDGAFAGVTKAMQAEGIDYSETNEGHEIRVLHFDKGDQAKLETLANTLASLASEHGLASQGFTTLGDIYEGRDYRSNLGEGGDSNGAARPSSLFRGLVDHFLVPHTQAISSVGYRFDADRYASRFGIGKEELAYLKKQLAQYAPRSSVGILTGDVALPDRKGRQTNVDAAWFMQNRAAEMGVIKPTDRSAAAKEAISETFAQEVEYQVSKPEGKSAMGWYDRQLTSAMKTIAAEYPEIGKDKNAEFVLKGMMAITSQGLTVEQNFNAALKMYLRYKDTGKIDLTGVTLPGKAAVVAKGNVEKLNAMIKTQGLADAGKWMRLQFTVRELKAQGYDVTGRLDDKVRGWNVLGPKIGSFANNLDGDFNTLTADLWFSRTWNRALGTMFRYSAKAEAKQIREFRTELVHALNTPGHSAVVDGLSAEDRAKVGDFEADYALAERLRNDFAKGGYKDKTELNRKAKGWVENTTQLQDTPRGDPERRWQDEVMREVQAKVEQRTGQKIDIADLQALLWYQEKELFRILGAANKASAPLDYQGAAKAAIAKVNGEHLGSKAPVMPAARYPSTKTQDDIEMLLEEYGQGIASARDALDRYNRGDRIFGLLSSGKNEEITHREDLDDYQPGEMTALTGILAGKIEPGEHLGSKGVANQTPEFKRHRGESAQLPYGVSPEPRVATSPQIKTPAFKRWFGDSKAVDAKGRPIVVYHGADVDEGMFDRFHVPEGEGVFFATDPAHAEAFVGGDGEVVSAYLSMQNPVIIDQDELERRWDQLPEDDQDIMLPRMMVHDVITEARAAGHDGVIVRGMADLDFSDDVYIAFKPEQIKHSEDNDGKFDPQNPSFLGARDATIVQTAYPLGSDYLLGKLRRIAPDARITITAGTGKAASRIAIDRELTPAEQKRVQAISGIRSVAPGTFPTGPLQTEAIGDRKVAPRFQVPSSVLQSRHYAALDESQEAVVDGAIAQLKTQGYPASWLKNATYFFAHNNDQTFSARFYLGGETQGAISLKQERLGDRKTVARDLAHELAHSADFDVATGGFHSVNSPRFDLKTQADGSISYTGDIVAELRGAHQANTPLTEELNYPFNEPEFSDDLIKAEAFAQATMLYFTQRADLKRYAPLTHAMIQEMVNDASSGPNRRVAALQKALRSTSSRAINLRVPQRPGGVNDRSVNQGQQDRSTTDRGQSRPGGASLNESSKGTGALGVQDAGGIRGGDGVLAERSRPDHGDAQVRQADGSLRGLPRNVGGFRASAFATAQDVAAKYMEDSGRRYSPPNTYVKADPVRAAKIATAYTSMSHDPQNPKVKAAYKAMIDETLAQYQAILDSGLTVSFIRGENPYEGNPRLMTEDVRNNNHMAVYSTRDGFGSDETFDSKDNPLLAETEHMISGEVALANDIFRVVHDYFGHVKEGVGFRADGEENAWRAHSAMYSPLARQAMTSETRGQNSWVNYGPNGEANRSATGASTVYADQKIGLLPAWVGGHGRTDASAEAVGSKAADSADTPAEHFFNGLDEITKPNPFGGSEQVFFHSNGGGYGSVAVSPIKGDPKAIYLNSLRAFGTGHCYGSYVLGKLTDLADKHGVTIELHARPFGNEKGLAKGKLVAWYKRHGFTGTAERLVRQPVKPDAPEFLGSRAPGMPPSSEGFTGYTIPSWEMGDHLSSEAGKRIEGYTDAAKAGGDKLRMFLQDYFLPVRRVQEAIQSRGGTVTDDTDVYAKEEVYYGRTGEQLRKIEDDHVKPLIKALVASKVKQSDLELYLYAKFAPARNARIASINEKFPDGGSGMTNADAAQVLADYEREGQTAKLEALAERVRALNAMRLDTLEEGGLLSPGEADLWRQEENYVPLKGFAEGLSAKQGAGDIVMPTGKGFSIGGKEAQKALGRKSRATDILANTIAQVEQAVIRAEKNRVATSLLRLAEENPNPSLWSVDQVPEKPQLSAAGEVTYRKDPRHVLADNVVAVKIAGEQHLVTLHDKRLATSMKNLGAGTTNSFLHGASAINRFLSLTRTMLAPEFVLANFSRDIQTASINLTGEQSAGMAARVIKDIPQSMRAMWGQLGGKSMGGEWGRWAQEFADEGGMTSFVAQRSVEEQQAKINGLLKSAEGGAVNGALNLAKGTLELIETANGAVENGTRLSAYAAARRMGMSKQQAASLAKNLTTNFNRKGQAGPVINALYLFYNASIQGTQRFLHAMRSPKVRKLMAATAVVGFTLAMANRANGGKDDDGEDRWDKIPDWEKARNLIFMLPGGKGDMIKIPLPYTYNLPFLIGTNVESTVNGRKSVSDASVSIMQSILTAFNPIGDINLHGDTTTAAAKLLSPTFADPLVDMAVNQNFFGSPINPVASPFDKVPDPDSQMAFPSANPVAKWLAESLNTVTGGDKLHPGAIDVSPGSLSYVFDYLTGGTGSFVSRTAGATMLMVQGEPVPARMIPFARVFAGSLDDRRVTDTFYQTRADVNLKAEMAKTPNLYTSASEKQDMQLGRRMEGQLKGAEHQLQALRKQRKLATARNDDARVKALTAQEQAVQLRFNTAYFKALNAIGLATPPTSN